MDVGDIHRLKRKCVNGPDVVYILDVLSVADETSEEYNSPWPSAKHAKHPVTNPKPLFTYPRSLRHSLYVVYVEETRGHRNDKRLVLLQGMVRVYRREAQSGY
jgi:hypothetical protein